jgi:molybdopterin-containing oxidoreductase family molybdopterin binding subunit
MMINWGANPVMSAGNRDTIEDYLKKIPFMVDIEILPTETSEGFADIILPDCCSLEHTANCGEAYAFYFHGPLGNDDFSFHIRQPVVESQFQRRSILDVMLDISERLNVRDRLNTYINRRYWLDEKHKIVPGEKLTMEQITDRVFRNNHGEDYGIDWFKEHGFIRWKKKPDEAYWRWFIDARVPIYIHELAYYGPKIKKLAESVDIHVDWNQYTGLVSWFPTPSNKETGEYDLYCMSYRDTLHTGSGTMQIPLLDEASHLSPYTYNIVINESTAKKRGLKSGDVITIESNYGRKIEGPLKTSQGIHPEVIAIATTAGHWVKGQPIAYGKGVNFDVLVELDLEHVDPTVFNIETSVKVKITKVSGN